MKKRIIIYNILFICIIVFCVVSLSLISVLTYELECSPQFLVHIIEYENNRMYYQAQDSLIALWKNYCYIAISFLSISIISASFVMAFYNHNIRISEEMLEKKKLKKETKMQKQISDLQCKLEELQKDE